MHFLQNFMNKKKNILLLIPTFAVEGGTQKMVYELGKLLSERYNVYECSFDTYKEKHVFKNENTVLSLRSSSSWGLVSKIVGYPIKFRRLRKLKKQHNIDITISNLWAADLVNVLSGGPGRRVSIGHINIAGNIQNKLLYRFRRFAHFVYKRFDKIVAVSEPLQDELSEIFKLNKEKITFINNFIDFPKERTGSIFMKPAGKRLITVGRLNPVKNQVVLIQLFGKIKKQINNLQLVFIGDGPLMAELINFSKTSGHSVSRNLNDAADIIFAGFNSNPFPILSCSTLFLFPSKSEGLPLVLAEAMFAGLPLVTSDCPTGPHMILKGKGEFQPGRKEVEETPYGYLMPIPEQNDEHSLEKWEIAILDLLRNEQKYDLMSENCKKRALDFSKDSIKENWFNLLEGL